MEGRHPSFPLEFFATLLRRAVGVRDDAVSPILLTTVVGILQSLASVTPIGVVTTFHSPSTLAIVSSLICTEAHGACARKS